VEVPDRKEKYKEKTFSSLFWHFVWLLFFRPQRKNAERKNIIFAFLRDYFSFDIVRQNRILGKVYGGGRRRRKTKVSIPKTNILMTSEIRSGEMGKFLVSAPFNRSENGDNYDCVVFQL
jgi:hypothetical protein